MIHLSLTSKQIREIELALRTVLRVCQTQKEQAYVRQLLARIAEQLDGQSLPR